MRFVVLDKEDYPWHLLLEADPNRERVTRYLASGECVGMFDGDHLIGAFVVVDGDDGSAELMNICVDSRHRGRGHGKQLIYECVRRVRLRGIGRIEVGTGNSSLNQLAFYQKCGFRFTGVDIDFFPRNYEQPIVENGIPCRDLVRLSLILD